MDQRAIHAIVHVFEPARETPMGLICLSRTKIDSTAPEPPSTVTPSPCTADHHLSSHPLPLYC